MINLDFYNNAISSVNDINIIPSYLNNKDYEKIKKEKIQLVKKAKIRIKKMTKSFQLSQFYNSKNNMMAGIIITPNQIATIYGNGEIFHDQIKPIVLELINNPKKQNPIIFIKCGIRDGAKVMAPDLIGDNKYVTNKMREALDVIINQLKIIGENDILETLEDFKNKKTKGFKNMFYCLKTKVGEDKEIVGLKLDTFIEKNLNQVKNAMNETFER